MDKKAIHAIIGILIIILISFSLYDLFSNQYYDGITPLYSEAGVVVGQIEKNSPAFKGGIKKGDLIEGVDHSLVTGMFEISSILNKAESNKVTYFIKRIQEKNESNETIVLDLIKKRNITLFNSVSSAISFILFLISFMLLLNNPETTETSVFYYLNGILLIFFTCVTRNYSYSLSHLIFRLIGSFAIMLLPILMVHFLSVYPYKNKLITKKKWIVPSVYIFSLMLTMSYLGFVYFVPGFLLQIKGRLALYFLSLFFLILGYFSIKSSSFYHSLETPPFLNKIYLICISPFALVGLPANLLMRNLKAFQFFSFPILFFVGYLAYSVLKFGFVNVRIVLKKSFLYSLILIILSALYAMVIFYLTQSFNVLNLDPYVYSIGFAIIIVFLFNPLNQAIKTQLEVLMFKKEKELTEKVAVNAEKLFEITDRMELETSILNLLRELIKKDFILFINTEDFSYKVVGSHKIIIINSLGKEKQDMILLEKLNIEGLELFFKKGFRFGYPVYKANKMKAFVLSRGHLYLDEREAIKRMLLQFITAFDNTRLVEKVAKQVELEKDMEIAGMIQNSLIPSVHPNNSFIKAYGISKPSKIVGGDFFDYSYYPESNKIGFLIGDVAGKSIPAALMMVAAKEILDLQSSIIPDIGKMMDEASKLIYQKSSKNMFVAACYSILNPATNTLHMVNAGMPSPILIRDNEISPLPKQKIRYPLGLIKTTNYQEQIIKLKDNDKLMFFTDGISETYDRALEKIVLMSENDSPERMSKSIMKQLGVKSGNILEDDATLVVVKMCSQNIVGVK